MTREARLRPETTAVGASDLNSFWLLPSAGRKMSFIHPLGAGRTENAVDPMRSQPLTGMEALVAVRAHELKFKQLTYLNTTPQINQRSINHKPMHRHSYVIN